MTMLTAMGLVFQRALRQSLRNPAWVILGIIERVLHVAFFAPLIANTPGFPPGDALSADDRSAGSARR